MLPAALQAGAEWLVVEEDEVGDDPFGAVERSLARGTPNRRGMTEPMRVGVVGCGIIAARYVKDSSGVRALAARRVRRPRTPPRADAFAAEHGLRALTVDALIADPEVELVLNLTPPKAHAAVVRASLAAGKHVYTEKPLAALGRGGA